VLYALDLVDAALDGKQPDFLGLLLPALPKRTRPPETTVRAPKAVATSATSGAHVRRAGELACMGAGAGGRRRGLAAERCWPRAQ